jgi:hypothetical protein
MRATLKESSSIYTYILPYSSSTITMIYNTKVTSSAGKISKVNFISNTIMSNKQNEYQFVPAEHLNL